MAEFHIFRVELGGEHFIWEVATQAWYAADEEKVEGEAGEALTREFLSTNAFNLLESVKDDDVRTDLFDLYKEMGASVEELVELGGWGHDGH